MMATDPLDTTRYEGELAKEQKGADVVLGQIADVNKRRADNIAQQEKETKPFTEGAIKEAGDISQLAEKPLPPSEAAGMVFAPHEIDKAAVTNFSWSLIGLALLGGAVSHGNWLGVSSSLNGAMKGFINGDQTRRDREWEDFNRKFSAAEKHDKAVLDRIDRVMDNKNLSLNAKRQQIRLIADEHGLEDMRMAAEIGSYDAILKQRQARSTALENIISRKENLKASLGAAMDRRKMPPGGTVEMSPAANEVYNRINFLTAGKSEIVRSLNSRWSRQAAAPQFDQMVSTILARDPTMTPEQLGTELVQNSIKYQGDIAAYRQTIQRSAGVARLALSVQGMETKVIAAAEKYGVSDARWANKTLNSVRDKLGDADYTKFRNEIVAVARQYIEAVTMPGSNAQLHASSQETADKMISDDMTLDQIKGAFAAFNEEIEMTGGALQTINERLLDSLGKKQLKGLFSYTGDAATTAAAAAPAAPTPKSAPAISADDQKLIDRYAPRG